MWDVSVTVDSDMWCMCCVTEWWNNIGISDYINIDPPPSPSFFQPSSLFFIFSTSIPISYSPCQSCPALLTFYSMFDQLRLLCRSLLHHNYFHHGIPIPPHTLTFTYTYTHIRDFRSSSTSRVYQSSQQVMPANRANQSSQQVKSSQVNKSGQGNKSSQQVESVDQVNKSSQQVVSTIQINKNILHVNYHRITCSSYLNLQR